MATTQTAAFKLLCNEAGQIFGVEADGQVMGQNMQDISIKVSPDGVRVIEATMYDMKLARCCWRFIGRWVCVAC
jgi:hypothetical protein